MAGNTGNIVSQMFIAIGLNLNGVNKGMNQLSKQLDGGMKSIIKSVAAPAIAAFAGVTSGKFVSEMIAGAKSASKFGKYLGMTTEEMSAWGDTAQAAGIDLERLVETFSKVAAAASTSMEKGTGTFAELVNQGLIGSLTDADGKLKGTEELILELSDVLKNMDPGKATAVAKSVGIENVQQIALFRRGRTELERTVATMKKQGAYTEEDAKKAREFSGSLLTVTRAIRNMLLPVFRLIIPVMSSVAQGFAYMTRHIEVFYPLLAVLAMAAVTSFKNVAKAAALSFAAMVKTNPILTAFIALGIVLGLLYDDFKAFQKGAENAAFPGLWAAITETKDGVVQIKEEYVKFAKAFGGVATMLYGSFKLYKIGVAILNSGFMKLILTVARFGVTALLAIGPIGWAIMAVIAICGLLYVYWDKVSAFMKAAWEAVCTTISAWWQSTCQAISEWFDNCCNAISAAWDSATSGIASVWNSIVGALTSTWEGFMSILRTAFSWISNKFTWLTDGLGKLKNLLPSLNDGIQMLNTANGNSYNSSSQKNQTNNFYVQGNMDKAVGNQIVTQINTDSQNSG